MNEPSNPPPTESITPPLEPPAGAEPTGNPWEQRDTRGFASGLIDNLKIFITNPTEAFAQTRRSGDYLSPLLFAVIVGTIGSIMGQIWNAIFGASITQLLPAEYSDQFGAMMIGSAASTIAGILFAPILVTVVLFIWSGIVHLFLMLVGGAAGSDSGFEGTFRAASYAQVASLAQIIPFFGGLITGVWGIVLVIIGLIRMHRTSGGKAAAATLLPLVLCCICGVVAAIVFGTAIVAAMGAAAQ